jgi:DNA-binding transcriptional MerR regulator
MKRTPWRVTVDEAEDLLGISARTLRDWAKRGLLVADKEKLKPGRGRAGWALTMDTVLEAMTLQDLRDRGLSMRKLRRIIEELRAQQFRLVQPRVLAIGNPATVLVLQSGKVVAISDDSAQGVIDFDVLRPVKKSVRIATRQNVPKKQWPRAMQEYADEARA